MAISTGTTARRSGRGRGKFVLFGLLVVFGLGFYTGTWAIKRAANGPAWVQRLFGLPQGTVASVSPVVNAPVTNAPHSGTPTNTPPSSPPVVSNAPGLEKGEQPTLPLDAGGASGGTGSSSHSSTPTDQATNNGPSNAPADANASHEAPAASDDLDRSVRDYNSILRKVQDSQHSYEAAHKVTSNPKSGSQAMLAALDRENVALTEIQSALQRAQALYDVIVANPQFAAKYKEMNAVLTIDRVPPTLLDSGADKLRFIRPQ